jgi:hypothetical protein
MSPTRPWGWNSVLVELLPKKSWLCDAPGWFGNTIGSSDAVWE